jgi:hypothetical protein
LSDSNYKISKTSFLKFEQCRKAFFLYKNYNHLKDPLSKDKQLTFKRGHDVGFAAQQLFPGGIDVSVESKNLQAAAQYTKELIEKKQSVIYEATFVFNHVLVMVDILVLDEKGYTAYEVKSSLKISETYIKDACLQYYVLKNILGNLNDFYLVNLNGEYVLGEELNHKELFKKRSIRSDAEKNFDYFSHQIDKMVLCLDQNVIPDIPIGKQCFSPYVCDFFGTCWKNTNQPDSIFNIGKSDREQLFNWYSSGIDVVEKIVDTKHLKPFITIQIEAIKNKTEYIDKDAIKQFFATVKGDICFLDMEIWSPAIPKYKGTKPFEQIPFLFSVCFQGGNGAEYINYFKPVETEGRESFLVALLRATQKFDTVIVYDKNLEVNILNQLQVLFPIHTELIQALLKKMKDISNIIHNFHYYHPGFKGNFSLKAVSELLFGESQYSGQQISSGLVAMNAYESLSVESNPIINETTKQQLIDYCNLDTYTGLKFFEFLKEKVN